MDVLGWHATKVEGGTCCAVKMRHEARYCAVMVVLFLESLPVHVIRFSRPVMVYTCLVPRCTSRLYPQVHCGLRHQSSLQRLVKPLLTWVNCIGHASELASDVTCESCLLFGVVENQPVRGRQLFHTTISGHFGAKWPLGTR